ncbi:MAG: PQQ-binding-like beta-propeller repeat protein [Planctomycetaceae bacterium]
MTDKNLLRCSLLLTMFVWQACSDLIAADWPRFRGPKGDGTSSDAGIPTEWSDSKNLKWQLKLPGAGFSSPIVVGKHVFLTAYSGSGSAVKRHLLCIDRETGQEIWSKAFDGVSDRGEPGFAYHGQASHTPVCDGERVYAMLGSSGVKVFDLSGKELWQQELGNERASRFGTASSPILYGDLLIVTAGPESESMRAFDKKTGKEVWKTEAGSLSGTYSTPLIAANAEGVDELLLSVTGEVWGLNPTSGKFKWYAETRVDTAACPSLLAHNGVAYVIGGRSGGRTAVRVGGKNDVTQSNVLWSESGGAYVPSPILHQERLFWINDRGIASCVDAKTGKELGRKRLGGRFYASVVLINNVIYAVSRFDGTYVLQATPKFEQIAHNKLADKSDFSGSPAVSDGQLFIRSDESLYCIAAE